MQNSRKIETFIASLNRNPTTYIMLAVVLSFLARLGIFFSTELFHFSDFAVYLDALDNIAAGNSQYLQENNYMFLLSYIGYSIREVTGSLHWFFVFNCAAGAAASLVIALLVLKLSKSHLAALLTVVLHSLYTEFMVFSSVFYTTVIMLLLVSLIVLSFLKFLTTEKLVFIVLYGLLQLTLFILSLFLKPELKYLPVVLIILSVVLLKQAGKRTIRIVLLGMTMMIAQGIIHYTGAVSAPDRNTLSNSFVFFGHTDYGGDGGEGAFIYETNRVRYMSEFDKYLIDNNIISPSIVDYNHFQKTEIVRFITKHPFEWALLQGKKFFSTFGVMPETISFKILVTGLLKGKVWLAAFLIVLPVILIISATIVLFNFNTLKDIRCLPERSHPVNVTLKTFLVLLLVYYTIATIFYGQYQERYRMILLVLFIIPALAIFIAKFDSGIFKLRGRLLIKGLILSAFFISWIFQAYSLLNENPRVKNVLRELSEYNALTNY